MTPAAAYEYLFSFAAMALTLLLAGSIFRSVRGPMLTDRVVAVSSGSTLILCVICLLVHLLGQGWLADVALVYALLGFVATAILGKVFFGEGHK